MPLPPPETRFIIFRLQRLAHELLLLTGFAGLLLVYWRKVLIALYRASSTIL